MRTTRCLRRSPGLSESAATRRLGERGRAGLSRPLLYHPKACPANPSTIHANTALSSMIVMMITTACLSGPGFLFLNQNMYIVCCTGLTVTIIQGTRVQAMDLYQLVLLLPSHGFRVTVRSPSASSHATTQRILCICRTLLGRPGWSGKRARLL